MPRKKTDRSETNPHETAVSVAANASQFDELISQGWAHVDSGNEKALDCFDKAAAIAKSRNDKSQLGIALNGKGSAHHSRGEYSLAKIEFEKSLQLANGDVDSDDNFMSSALNGLGNIAKDEGRYPEALDYYRDALQIARRLNNPERVATITMNIGSVLMDQNDTAGAAEHYSIALRTLHQTPDEKAYRIVLFNLANLASSGGDFENARLYLEEALPLAEKHDDLEILGAIQLLLGKVFYNTRNFDRAMEWSQKSVETTRSYGDYNHLPTAVAYAGLCSLQLGAISDAISAHEESLELSKQSLGPSLKVDAISNLALAYSQAYRDRFIIRGKSEDEIFLQAQGYLREAEDIIDTIVEESIKVNVYETISEAKSNLNDMAGAFLALRHSLDLKDKLYTAKAMGEIGSLHLRIKIEREEHENEMLSLKAEKNERDLSTSTLHLLAQTELLSDLRTDLLQIARKIPPQEPAARELRERVKRLPCESIDWEKFDTQFKAAHPDFVHKLMAAVPDISPMEIRISTLIRMNLKSEEIARLFCVTERAVEFHRLNIRKKMGLKTKDNLSLVLAKM